MRISDWSSDVCSSDLPSYYRGCWHEVSRCLFLRYRHPHRVLTHTISSRTKVLYNPKAFFTHAAWLDQGCPHCPIFPTADSRRSLEIGRATCRERVCKYVYISVDAVSLNKKKHRISKVTETNYIQP